jgi:hypothetical protein
MSRPPKQVDETQEQGGITLNINPDQLKAMITQPKKEKVVKRVDGDYIGAPNQPLVGTGEGLEDFEMWTVNMVMGNRTDAKGNIEGYPQQLEVLKKYRVTKSTEMAIELDNFHLVGTALHHPGVPNHLLMWFPKGKVKVGMVIPTDMTKDHRGKNLVIKWDAATMMYE